MKRVIFAAILLFAVICFNIFCINKITEIKTDLTNRLDALYSSVTVGESEKSALECEKFTEYWLSKHHILCRIVRHEPLEQVTIAVSAFKPLAEFGEKAELAAEILRCKILVEEIWDAERPIFRNIF